MPPIPPFQMPIITVSGAPSREGGNLASPPSSAHPSRTPRGAHVPAAAASPSPGAPVPGKELRPRHGDAGSRSAFLRGAGDPRRDALGHGEPPAPGTAPPALLSRHPWGQGFAQILETPGDLRAASRRAHSKGGAG